jgi:hypothetical protein
MLASVGTKENFEMARTSNLFTQIEADAFEAFFVKNDLVFDGAVGHKNGEILADFIANKMNADITAETLAAAVKVVKGLVFKTAAQREFDAIAGQLNASEKSTVTSWLERQKQLMLDGDPGLENFSIIVGWLRARNYPISEQNLNTALTNVLNGSKRQLHWKQAPEHKGGYGRHSGKTFEQPNTDSDEFYPNGRRRHSANPTLATEVPRQVKDSEWKSRSEAIKGNRHSETAALQRMFVNGPDGEIDWKKNL